MIQIYANDELTYDSRVEDYDLLGLKITNGINKGGTAEITMPAGHPAYHSYKAYQSIVEIYRDGDLRFRGRVLYTSDDFDNTRTVTCEGELCFFRDIAHRPHEHGGSSAESRFRVIVGLYPGGVGYYERKAILCGEVTAPTKDMPSYVKTEDPETLLDGLLRLADTFGGQFTFTWDPNNFNLGKNRRLINWVPLGGNEGEQVIEAGENLFDFTRAEVNTDLCTAVMPYGAMNSETGERVNVREYNATYEKSDIIRDEEAIAIYGVIVKPLVYDDIEDAKALYDVAKAYLDEHKHILQSLTVSALDLSYIDKSIESFKLGDRVRVISRAHGVNESFLLSELTEDLLNPERSLITLGKTTKTLTGIEEASINANRKETQNAAAWLRRGYTNAQQQTGSLAEQLSQSTSATNAILQELERRILALETK